MTAMSMEPWRCTLNRPIRAITSMPVAIARNWQPTPSATIKSQLWPSHRSLQPGVKFSRIPEPAPPFRIQHLSWEICYLQIEIRHPIITGNLSVSILECIYDLEPPFNAEICSEMSSLVITHYDSYMYTFKTVPFQHVAIVVFLVIERCEGHVHKLVIVHICTRRQS